MQSLIFKSFICRFFYMTLRDFFVKDILSILFISISQDISIHGTRIYLRKFRKRNSTAKCTTRARGEEGKRDSQLLSGNSGEKK